MALMGTHDVAYPLVLCRSFRNMAKFDRLLMANSFNSSILCFALSWRIYFQMANLCLLKYGQMPLQMAKFVSVWLNSTCPRCFALFCPQTGLSRTLLR